MWIYRDRVANSTAEAEFRAYNSAGRDALFLRKLDYDYMNHAQRSKAQAPTMIWDDNQTTIKWLKTHGNHAKTHRHRGAVNPRTHHRAQGARCRLRRHSRSSCRRAYKIADANSSLESFAVHAGQAGSFATVAQAQQLRNLRAGMMH